VAAAELTLVVAVQQPEQAEQAVVQMEQSQLLRQLMRRPISVAVAAVVLSMVAL
jgi:hypothetical protein